MKFGIERFGLSLAIKSACSQMARLHQIVKGICANMHAITVAIGDRRDQTAATQPVSAAPTHHKTQLPPPNGIQNAKRIFEPLIELCIHLKMINSKSLDVTSTRPPRARRRELRLAAFHPYAPGGLRGWPE
jgi:hypothetical protein